MTSPLGGAASAAMEPFISSAGSARMRLVPVLGVLLLYTACRTEPPEDEVPETSTARSRLTQLSKHAALSWLTQPDVRFSRNGTRILVDTHREEPLRARLELPVDATGFTSLTEQTSGMRIRQRLEHAQPATAESAKGLLFFRGAYQGFDFFQRPSADQVEDFISLPTRPEKPRVSYEVELAQGVSGLRLVAGVLEFMDARGDPRLRVGPARILGADNQWHDVRVELEGCAADRSPAAPWGRPVTVPGSSRCRVTFAWDDAPELYPAVFDPNWTLTAGNMVSPRSIAEAVLLNNNLILMAGGVSSYNPATLLNSAELYNEQTGTWTPTGSMGVARADFGMAFTASGSPRAVAVGGYSTAGLSLESYDPSTGTWGGGKALPVVTEFPEVLTRADGTVVIIGGQNDGGGCANRLTNVELYDPATSTVRSIAPMSVGRVLHSATLLPDGRVLVTGGDGTCCPSCVGNLNSTELLNTNLTWTRGANMQQARSYHASIVLPGGTRVLVAGDYGDVTTQSEVYNISSNTWSTLRPTGISSPIYNTHLTAISTNRVMIAGYGTTSGGGSSGKGTLIYDPTSDTWTSDNPLNIGRRGHVQVRTALGRTLVAGGAASGSLPPVLNTSEIYDALLNGAACTGNGLCASKLCVDGVCCDSACTNACDACNLPALAGTCTTVPVSTPGNPACANHLVCDGTSRICPTSCSSDTTCESGYYCASGTCQPKQPNGQPCSAANQCQFNLCVDGVCCNNSCTGSCNACNLAGNLGTCTNMPLGSAGNPVCPNHFVCSGGSSCPTACIGDQNCESGYYCLNFACVPKNPNGHPCTGANQCQSNFCVDGVCCNSACSGSCDACNISNPPGTCTPVPPGRAGVPACPNHFVCGGGPNCPLVCSNDQNCESGYFCLYGACQPKGPNGHPCDAANQCQSGFCVDGVCCNSACGNACDACNISGSVGTCSNIPAGTSEQACGSYLCNGVSPSCPTTCTTDQQCLAPAVCINGQCQAPQPPGQTCTRDSQCQSGFCADGVCCNVRCDGSCESCSVSGSLGTCKPLAQGTLGEPTCAPYVCDGSGGACPTHCTTDNQCATGAVCEHGTCTTDLRGHIGWACGCGSAPEGSAFFALILLGLVALRRSEVRP